MSQAHAASRVALTFAECSASDRDYFRCIDFFLVNPANKMMERMKKKEEAAPPAPAPDIVLLKEIRDLLKAR